MSRIFWDSMLLIYLLEGHQTFALQVRELLSRSFRRRDVLLTSHLSLAETLVSVEKGSAKEHLLLSTVEEIGFTLVDFNAKCVEPFRTLRRDSDLKPPDSMQLACASAAEVDLFITGDRQLLKKGIQVPGIKFICGFENTPL